MDYRRPTAHTFSPHFDDTIRRRSGNHSLSHNSNESGHRSSPLELLEDLTNNAESTFTAIELTPRLPFRERGREPSHSSMFSDITRASRMSRLPTPDFTSTSHASAGGSTQTSGTNLRPATGTLRSYLNRGLSFVSISIQPPAGFLSRQSSYESSSSDTTSYGRDDTQARCPSLHSSRSTLIGSVRTTDKFTNKWPRPKSLKSSALNRRKAFPAFGSGSGKDMDMALEDEAGLGIEMLGRWNKFKWILFLSVLLLFAYSGVVLAAVVSTWFRTWDLADVLYVADNDIIILATLSASTLLVTFIIGLTGSLLNSRPILAIYALLLWPSLISILVVGYISYKRATFALDRKLQKAWSQDYTTVGRLMIQNSLKCCGWFNALHEATMSNRCYPRTPLPGCKKRFYEFEKAHLEMIWKTIFRLIVPMHIMNIFVALLCANHVNETFGKGVTPKMYRLTAEDVREDKEEIRKRLVLSSGVERPLVRPVYARAGSSKGVHREDREGPEW